MTFPANNVTKHHLSFCVFYHSTQLTFFRYAQPILLQFEKISFKRTMRIIFERYVPAIVHFVSIHVKLNGHFECNITIEVDPAYIVLVLLLPSSENDFQIFLQFECMVTNEVTRYKISFGTTFQRRI